MYNKFKKCCVIEVIKIVEAIYRYEQVVVKAN